MPHRTANFPAIVRANGTDIPVSGYAFDASTAGTPGFTGGVTANPVTAGDTFTIPIGELTTDFTLAS